MHLTLHLTRNCNLRCHYCYSQPKPGPMMSLETGQKAMQFGLRANAGSCGIVFFGGEPLLAKDIIYELTAYGKSLQRSHQGYFHFKVTTNGLLLDDAFLDFAQKEDVAIALSFDGIQPAHDAHRRTPDGRGTYDLVLPRLRTLLKCKPYSSVIMVVNPDTVSHLTDSVSFLFDEGVRYLIVALNYAACWDSNSLYLLEQMYRQLAKLYIKWSLEDRKFYLSPFEVKIASHIKDKKANHLRCDPGIRQISVDPDGYLYPCVQFPTAGPQSRFCIGDVNQGIDSGAFDAFRRESCTPRLPCKECAIEPRCLYTCACLNFQTTGSPAATSPLLCNHEKMLMPIADEVAEELYQKKNKRFLQKHYNADYPILSFIEDHLSGA